MNSPSPLARAGTSPVRSVSARAVVGAALGLMLLASSSPLLAQAAPRPPGSASGTAGSPANAAAAKEEAVRMEAFVSTGTRFNDRTVVESPVPIDVVTSAEMRQGGYTETSQMLQALVPSFNFPRATIGDGTDHIRPAMLRGLAPDQTLVLVNGKRRHTSALVNVNGFVGRGSVSIDYNALPAAAIERAEVLRDGASAQYGSDAIAGVINLVLDRSLGYGATGLYGVTEEGDGIVREGSVFAGLPLPGKGYVHTTLSYRERGGTNRSRPDTRQQYFGLAPGGGTPVALNGNLNSGVTATANNGTSVAAAPTTTFALDPREATVGRLNHWQGDADSREQGIFVNAGAPVAAGEVYVFGGYTRRDGKSAGFFRRAGDDRTVRALYPDGFLPKINSDITDLSLGGGMKGEAAGGWGWDLSGVYGENTFEFFITDTANATLGAASPRQFRAGKLRFGQYTYNLDVTKRLEAGLKAPLKLAMGAEYRKDRYRIGAGEPDSYRDGGVRIADGPSAGALAAPGAQVFPGFRPSDATSVARHNVSLYADVENQLTERFLASVAGRYEDYSDFGSEFTAKASGRLALTSLAALRGSISSGFRAPHLAQQWFSSTATNFIGGQPFENKTFPVSDPVARLMGARSLEAETSQNYSAGATLEAGDGLSASVDFYRIEIDDRIVLSSTFIDPAGVSLIRDFLARNGQPQAIGGRFFTNAVDTRTEGVDVNVRQVVRTNGAGKLTATAGYNHNRTRVTRFSPTPSALQALTPIPLFDLTERIRMERSQPRNILNVALGWDLDKFSVLLRNVRYGQVALVATDNSGWTAARIAAVTPGFRTELAPAVPGITATGGLVPTSNQQVIQTFEAKWITDLDLTYRATPKLSVAIGANNLFDIYPTRNVASTAQYQGNDNVGIFPYNGISPFGFNGAFYYGRVSWKF